MSLISDYFNKFNYYKEIYGDNTVLFYQVGMFYESYSISNEKEQIGNAEIISKLLNIQLTKKSKKIIENNRKNPLLMGFPMYVLDKYLQILIEHNYTVIVIDQYLNEFSEIERREQGIYSPGTIINSEIFANYIICIYIENIKENLIIGLSALDPSSGEVIIFECTSLAEADTFIKCYQPKEILIYNTTTTKIELEINNVLSHIYIEISQNQKNIDYQNEYLSKIYNNNTMLSTLEYLDIEKYTFASLSLILLFDFIHKHNEKVLLNLDLPKVYSNDCYLKFNSLNQLDIFNENNGINCVFDVINKTSTAIGKRQLKKNLTFPIKDPIELNRRYNLIEKIGKLKDQELNIIKKSLNSILDLERLHRKMSIGYLNPFEFQSMDIGYKEVLKINKVSVIKFEYITLLNKFIEEYTEIFDITEMSKYKIDNIEKSFFNKGKNEELDLLQGDVSKLELELEEIAKKLSIKINENDSSIIKINFTENNGYHLHTTNIRANLLKKCVDLSKINFLSNKSGTVILSKEISGISSKMIELKNKLKINIKNNYLIQINEFFKKYQHLLKNIVKFIGEIDTILSNFIVSRENSYSRPIIIESQNSSVCIKKLRHPLIEKIRSGIRYIANDIEFNSDGIILNSVNSAGKTSLIKAVGVSIIMAQAGMYTPCESMELSLYHNIITRITGTDDILKGHSSFIVEMIDLKYILKNSNKNSMVIIDELCRGTETVSACAISAACLIELDQKKASYILATHLRFLSNYPRVKAKVKHLSVTIDKQNNIIFDRILKDGPGSELYGLEIAKSLGLSNEFMENAHIIRNELINKKNVLSIKKSKYNSKKNVDSCEVCGKTATTLDTHHIFEQCTANSNGIIETFHKNTLHNLVVLCKDCHQNVHNGNLIINGYLDTSSGKKLDFKLI